MIVRAHAAIRRLVVGALVMVVALLVLSWLAPAHSASGPRCLRLPAQLAALGERAWLLRSDLDCGGGSLALSTAGTALALGACLLASSCALSALSLAGRHGVGTGQWLYAVLSTLGALLTAQANLCRAAGMRARPKADVVTNLVAQRVATNDPFRGPPCSL